MKQVQIGTDIFPFAENWKECSGQQVQQILPLSLYPIDQLEPGERAALKWAIAQVLLQAPEALLEQLTTEQKWRLMRLAGWVFTARLESKPFDSFDFEGVTYFLPEENYANTSAIEIAMANIQYIAYTRKEQPHIPAVFVLVATLCRPARKDLETFRQSEHWNNDVREGYNTVLAESRAQAFQAGGLGVGIVMALLRYWEFTNNRFLEGYRNAYEPGDEDEAPLYQNGEGLVTTFMDIAKTGAFGDFDNVCKQNGHTIWMFLRDNNLKIRRANQRAEREADIL